MAKKVSGIEKLFRRAGGGKDGSAHGDNKKTGSTAPKKKKQKPAGQVKTVEQLALEQRLLEESDPEKYRKEKDKTPDELLEERQIAHGQSLILRGVLWLMAILLVIMAAFGFSHGFCRTIDIEESSMEPTVARGEVCLINSAAYVFGSPKRGDLIAYETGSGTDATMHVKRLIGLPGETVQIIDGNILINGTTYVEGERFPAIIDGGIAKEPVLLGSGEYFVLGDNRNGSEDSRSTAVGNIEIKQIKGKLWLRILPFGSFGLL